ncbi:hypothetical protein FACS1894184_13840 [Clostridia bacterium]|nr:hypothetical protein FACS1894184_13840 [Clostridia bacterium]
MTRRERVYEALNHRQTDFVPYHIGFTQQSYDRLRDYLGNSFDEFYENIGNHIHSAYYGGYPDEFKSEYARDDFGVVWNRTGADKDIGVIDRILIPEPDMSGYRFPEPPEERIRRECEAVIAGAGDRFRVAGIGFSLFERAWTLTGMENLLAYMITEPAFTRQLFDAIVEYNLKILRIMLEYNFDCVYFGDDWGQQRGLIMGPRLWREFIKPSLAVMYGAVRERGLFIAQHSCGDIHEVFEDVIDLGLNVYQTFQPEIYDVEQVKYRYGDKLSFWGGISTQRLLPYETPEGVVREARRIIKVCGQGGGYIAAPTHDLPGDVPPENIVALVRLFQQGG